MPLTIVITPDDKRCWYCWLLKEWGEEDKQDFKNIAQGLCKYKNDNDDTHLSVCGKIRYCPFCGKELYPEDEWERLECIYANDFVGVCNPWTILGSVCNEEIIDGYIKEYKKQNEEIK